MTDGDAFYLREAVAAGMFPNVNEYVIVHQPGIVSRVIGRSPPGLSETCYTEHVIQLLKQRGFARIAVMGFSAGSMLAIAMASRADAVDAVARLANPDSSRMLMCVVAIHGPDRIRDVFETHRNWWLRLDRYFAFSLFSTMRYRAQAHAIIPRIRPLLLDWAGFGWLEGWPWMKRLTETTFDRTWDSMEDSLWSCQSAMRQPLRTPVMRLISRCDPIVNYESVRSHMIATCVAESWP
jgi:pimeloyl-ACP methyl ester carboxylesterase